MASEIIIRLLRSLAVFATYFTVHASGFSCDVGEYFNGSEGVCTLCAAGSFQSLPNSSAESCQLCGAGQWAPTTGMSTCFQCPKRSNSSAGSSSCDLVPSCSPCITRETLVIGVVVHGRTMDTFWMRLTRAMTVAATQLGVDLRLSLSERSSLADLERRIDEVTASEYDALIVSIPDASILTAVTAAAQRVPLFTINSGRQWASQVGSLAHFGMDDDAAGYGTWSHFEARFASSGQHVQACLTIPAELDNVAPLSRAEGFHRACQENGAAWLGAVAASGPTDVRQAAIQSYLLHALEALNSTDAGLAVLLLGERNYVETRQAWINLGQPSSIRVGFFDLSTALDEGLSDGFAAFGIDQGAWIQGYLSVTLATLYVSTGQLMPTKLYPTGPRYVTTARSEEEALRHAEGAPICNCPLAGGNEAAVECGPDIAGIEAIGDCPLDSCNSPCMDIRKFAVQGVTDGLETNDFWFKVKAGAEQAANDLRLVTHNYNLYKHASADSADSYSEELMLQHVIEASEDPNVDGIYLSIKPTSAEFRTAVTTAANLKPVVSINAGIDRSVLYSADSSYLLNFVGQNETAAGAEAGKRLMAAGVTHAACLSVTNTSVNEARCSAIVQVFVEAGLAARQFRLYEWGGNDSSDDAIMAASLAAALAAHPGVNGLVSLGSADIDFMRRGWFMQHESDNVVFATFDLNAAVIAGVESGEFLFAVDQLPYLQGYLGVLLLGIYRMSGDYLLEHVLMTGPSIVDAGHHLVMGDFDASCLERTWTEDLVGKWFLPSVDAALVAGFPVCALNGSCQVAGAYFDVDEGECHPCPAGSFSNSTTTSCHACPAGSSTNGNGGSEECYPCGKGLYSTLEGQADCSYCPQGEYSNITGATTCEACAAPFSTEHIASVSHTECLCTEGLYGSRGNYSDPSSVCLPCPDGMFCPFGSHEDYGSTTIRVAAKAFPQVKAGYMTRSNAPLMPYKCLVEEWCPGGPAAFCHDTRDGSSISCGLCLPGYYKQGLACEPCANANLPLVLVAFLVFFFFVLVCTLLANSGSHMRSQSTLIVVILASLLFTNFQTLSVFDNLSFDWFEPVKSIITAVGAISVMLQFARAFCMFNLDSPTKFVIYQLVLPLSIPWCCVVVLAKKYCPFTVYRNSKTHVITEVTTAVGSLMGMFFITILMSCLSPFVCFNHPGDAGSSVRQFPEILCDFQGHHLRIVGTAITSLLLVPVPFLANACLVTYQYSKMMALEARRSILHKYRFLFFRFHPQAYFYGLVLIFRSLLVCFVPVVIRGHAGLQICVLAFIIIFSTEFQCLLKPWRAQVCNYVDALMLALLLGLLICAPLAVTIESDRRPLQLLGLLSVVGMIALAVITISLTLIRLCRRSAFYDIFLCHHKEHAAAQARFIKTCISSMSAQRVFIDSDDLLNLDRLFDTIQNHVGVFIIYLTMATLRRAWCCGELVSARRAELKKWAVFTTKFTKPSGEEMDNLQEYVIGLDQTLGHYGISMEMVREAICELLLPSTPSISLQSCGRSGTSRYLWVARTLIGQRDVHSVRVMKEFVVAISAPREDDEAVATAGYLAAHLRRLISQNDGGGDVLCLCDFAEVFADKPNYGEARGAVVVLSPDSMRSADQLSNIVDIMQVAEAYELQEQSFAVVPVHLPGLCFPTEAYFREDLPRIWQGEEDVARVTELVKACFKHISLLLEVSASDEVLNAQVNTIFHRIPPSVARHAITGASESPSHVRSSVASTSRVRHTSSTNSSASGTMLVHLGSTHSSSSASPSARAATSDVDSPTSRVNSTLSATATSATAPATAARQQEPQPQSQQQQQSQQLQLLQQLQPQLQEREREREREREPDKDDLMIQCRKSSDGTGTVISHLDSSESILHSSYIMLRSGTSSQVTTTGIRAASAESPGTFTTTGSVQTSQNCSATNTSEVVLAFAELDALGEEGEEDNTQEAGVEERPRRKDFEIVIKDSL